MPELMVVIAIAGIVAAIALPGFSSFSSRKSIQHQADRIGAQLHHVRSLAVEQGISWRVVFTPNQARWVCFGDANRNLLPDPGEQRLGPYTLARGIAFGCSAPEGPNRTTIPSDGISFTANRVSFSPMGACNAGTIYVRAEEKSLALRVLPASGTVLIYGYTGSWKVMK